MKNQEATNQVIQATLKGNLEEVEALLRDGVDVNCRDSDGRTPLMHAVIDGNLEIVDLLLTHNADASLQDRRGNTALHFAAQEQRVAVTERLIQVKDVNIDPRDGFGNTPLWKAVFSTRDGDGAVIRLFIDNGADKDLVNDHGVSPRILAETIANYDVKKFLEH